MSNYLNSLHEERRKVFADAQGIVDRAHAEKRANLTGEEEAAYQRASSALRDLDQRIRSMADDEQREREADTARQAFAPFITPLDDDGYGPPAATQTLERWMRGDRTASNTGDGRDAFEFDMKPAARASQALRQGATGRELRTVLTDGGASGGSLNVPTTFAAECYSFMEASSTIRQLARVITTSSGEPMKFPRLSAHSIGTQVIAQGTAIGGTDPIFATPMQLDSYKFGELCAVSTEATTDMSFDVLSFVAEQVGRAIGRVTDTGYAIGTGSSTIQGVVPACTGSVVTGGSLITATYEKLIDLQHSVVAEYRDNGSFVMLDSTLGTLRKVRADAGGTTGPWLVQPPSAPGVPSMILGSPVYTDFNIAAQGSAASSVVYGDFRSYYIRDAGTFRFERSDDFGFDKDLIYFRGVLRSDGDLIDSAAVKVLKQQVS